MLEPEQHARHNGAMPDERQDARPLLIKRYAKRRLYNTATSTYVSLDDLVAMVLSGERFKVVESETGDDITRTILDRLH